VTTLTLNDSLQSADCPTVPGTILCCWYHKKVLPDFYWVFEIQLDVQTLHIFWMKVNSGVTMKAPTVWVLDSSFSQMSLLSTNYHFVIPNYPEGSNNSWNSYNGWRYSMNDLFGFEFNKELTVFSSSLCEERNVWLNHPFLIVSTGLLDCQSTS